MSALANARFSSGVVARAGTNGSVNTRARNISESVGGFENDRTDEGNSTVGSVRFTTIVDLAVAGVAAADGSAYVGNETTSCAVVIAAVRIRFQHGLCSKWLFMVAWWRSRVGLR